MECGWCAECRDTSRVWTLWSGSGGLGAAAGGLPSVHSEQTHAFSCRRTHTHAHAHTRTRAWRRNARNWQTHARGHTRTDVRAHAHGGSATLVVQVNGTLLPTKTSCCSHPGPCGEDCSCIKAVSFCDKCAAIQRGLQFCTVPMRHRVQMCNVRYDATCDTRRGMQNCGTMQAKRLLALWRVRAFMRAHACVRMRACACVRAA